TSGLPFATGTADGMSADIILSQTVVGQLPNDVTDPIEDGLGQIIDALDPIAEGDPTGAIDGLTDALDGLVDDLASGPLARIHSGHSTSTTTFENRRVNATANAAGAVVVLLPAAASTALLPQGLAVIEVGPSSASASANGIDRATTDARPSIARITLLPGVLDGLPGLDPDSIDELPLDEILDLLPPEVTDLLPIDDLMIGTLAGADAEDVQQNPATEDPATEDPATEDPATEDPATEDPATEDPEEGDATAGDDSASATPLEDVIGGFMQADASSGGFVIELTGTERTCILEDTPLETCVTLGGSSETFTADGLGVGVLAAGVDISALRGDETDQAAGPGLIEMAVGRAEAGVAAAFVRAAAPTTPARPPLPQTGGQASFVVPSLALMALSGVALATLRRRVR
ncbi:MAG TPA: LPXTG cell wall anchor domain-containing protein, partial [Euzebya sp.]|nr:LPXTG cell wall anchor domain-containing protein [Euzebya sp.]